MQPSPLTEIRVIELAGLAPVPYCGLLLADYGATVLRIDRPAPLSTRAPSTDSGATSNTDAATPDRLTRGKSSLALDLKSPRCRALLVDLLRHADVLLEPYRPGVLEALGLDPEMLVRDVNPRLIVGRLTGFPRQDEEISRLPRTRAGRSETVGVSDRTATSVDSPSPSGVPNDVASLPHDNRPYTMRHLSSMAGHDINYLAQSGVLSRLGPSDPSLPPSPPLNMLADFAGGGLVLFSGILLALLARTNTGRGQIVEANMLDGVAHLATFLRLDLGPRPSTSGPFGGADNEPGRDTGSSTDGGRLFGRSRGQGILGGSCPFYRCYTTRDGGHMAVGALEDRFFAVLARALDLPSGWITWRHDPARWAELMDLMDVRFRARTRDEWTAALDGTDACCTPVLEMHEGPAQGARPLVTLSGSIGTGALFGGGDPAVAPGTEEAPDGRGKGTGSEVSRWAGGILAPGWGGEHVLQQWTGWEKGREYEVMADGSFVALRSVGTGSRL